MIGCLWQPHGYHDPALIRSELQKVVWKNRKTNRRSVLMDYRHSLEKWTT
jgi:hypothetical protein